MDRNSPININAMKNALSNFISELEKYLTSKYNKQYTVPETCLNIIDAYPYIGINQFDVRVYLCDIPDIDYPVVEDMMWQLFRKNVPLLVRKKVYMLCLDTECNSRCREIYNENAKIKTEMMV